MPHPKNHSKKDRQELLVLLMVDFKGTVGDAHAYIKKVYFIVNLFNTDILKD